VLHYANGWVSTALSRACYLPAHAARARAFICCRVSGTSLTAGRADAVANTDADGLLVGLRKAGSESRPASASENVSRGVGGADDRARRSASTSRAVFSSATTPPLRGDGERPSSARLPSAASNWPSTSSVTLGAPSTTGAATLSSHFDVRRASRSTRSTSAHRADSVSALGEFGDEEHGDADSGGGTT